MLNYDLVGQLEPPQPLVPNGPASQRSARSPPAVHQTLSVVLQTTFSEHIFCIRQDILSDRLRLPFIQSIPQHQTNPAAVPAPASFRRNNRPLSTVVRTPSLSQHNQHLAPEETEHDYDHVHNSHPVAVQPVNLLSLILTYPHFRWESSPALHAGISQQVFPQIGYRVSALAEDG